MAKSESTSDPARVVRLLDGALLVGTGAAFALRVLGGGAGAAIEEPSLTLVHSLFAIAAAVAAGLRVAVEGEGPRFPPLALAGGLLLAGSALALAGRAENGFLAMRQAVDFVALVLLGFAFLAAIAPAPRERGAALAATALGLGAAAALAGFLEYHFELAESRRAYARDPAVADIAPELRAELEGRLAADQAAGPFVIPNLLGAALALLSPLAAATAVAALRSRRDGGRGALALAVGAALIAAVFGYGIALSAAKGAFLVLGVGLATFGLAAWRGERAPASADGGWRRAALFAVGIGLASAIATALLVLVPRERLAALPGGTSFAVRHDYAVTGLRMVAESPGGGGPGSFSERYTRHRVPGAEETRLAHDDPLQVLIEQGPAGLAGLLLLWGGLLAALVPARGGKREGARGPDAAPSPDRTPTAGSTPAPSGTVAPAWLLPVGGLAGILALPGLGLAYVDLFHTGAFALAFAAVALPIRRGLAALAAREPALLAAGAAGAIAALLASATIDFVHYEPGLPALALAVGIAGLGLGLRFAPGPAAAAATGSPVADSRARNPIADSPAGRPAAAAPTRSAGAAARSAPPAGRPLSAPLRGLAAALPLAAFAFVARGPLPGAIERDAAFADGARALRAGDLAAAAGAYERAALAVPSDPTARVAVGDVERRLFEVTGRREHLDRALAALREAVRLRPGGSDFRARLADLLLAHFRAVDPRLDGAVEAAEAAARLYPTRARYRLQAGYIRRLRREDDAARRHIDAARALDAVETIGRLKLDRHEREMLDALHAELHPKS